MVSPLEFEVMRADILKAQLLAVLVSYLQGTQHSSKAWTFHGLAVKTALELGLHDEDSARNASVKEKEMRKRAWCWIVIHDRYVPDSLAVYLYTHTYTVS